MKRLFVFFLCMSFSVCGIERAFCQQETKPGLVESAGIAGADRVELIPEVTFELPAQPLRVIDDPSQIRELCRILEEAVPQEPCDCLPEYTLCFYKKDVLVAKISFGAEDGFLRYQQQDYRLPPNLLAFLEL